jgi:hypothetical protein
LIAGGADHPLPAAAPLLHLDAAGPRRDKEKNSNFLLSTHSTNPREKRDPRDFYNTISVVFFEKGSYVHWCNKKQI